MKTLSFTIMSFAIIAGLGLVTENAFAISQNTMPKYVLTFNQKEYSIYYNAINTTVDKISLGNADRGAANPILLNVTTGKYASLALFIPIEFADSYLIGSQCSPNDAGNLVMLEDGMEILPVVNFTNNFLKITLDPLPTDTKSIEIFEDVIGGPGPMSSLFGIPDSIKANPGQQVHLEGTVEDLCGRPELFNNTINLNVTSQISIKNYTVTTNDSKFILDFVVPKDTKLGIYDALFSWQFYERQPLHLFVGNEKIVPIHSSNTTRAVNIDTFAKLSDLDLYDKDHYSTIQFYGFDWSPDGKFLYALVNVAPNYAIWKINIENNTVTKVLDIAYNTVGYPFEILGVHDNTILFVTTKYNPVGSLLYIYKFDMGKNTLAQNQISSPDPLTPFAFTSDGNLIYEQDVGGRISESHDIILWLVDSDGHKLKKIHEGTTPFFGADLSSNGKRLVFRDLGLKVFDIQNSTFMNIPSPSSTEWPKWSPNNQYVTYAGNGLGGGSVIVADVNNNATEVVYDTMYEIQHPSISPDGRSIAFGINYDSGGRNTTVSGIYLVNLANPVPEFPFAIPVFVISIVSLIIFYRMKFK